MEPRSINWYKPVIESLKILIFVSIAHALDTVFYPQDKTRELLSSLSFPSSDHCFNI